MILEWGWKFVSWLTGVPVEQLKCKHPFYAREAKLRLIVGEQEGWDAYEQCLNCGREFHEK